MIKYWYRRILIMVVVFTVAVGGSYYYIEEKNSGFRKAVSASTLEKEMVIPGGMPVGIYLETEGALVLGTQELALPDGTLSEPAKHLVKAGDYITKINGEAISNKKDLLREVRGLEDGEVVLTLHRGEEEVEVVTSALSCEDGVCRLGIWVRDNAQGLGTITYLKSDSTFGALGHGIHDVDTSSLLDITEGTLYMTSIKDIQRGETGLPGGMEGIIVYNNYNVLGTITKNTEEGIFGEVEKIGNLFKDQTPVEVADEDEIEEGAATIRCAVSGEVKEYQVRITKINTYAREVNKSIVLEITDEDLLNETGGIVQGMSGSPILQNGKLVGAVTHVFVNDPTKGYGISIEDMLNAQ